MPAPLSPASKTCVCMFGGLLYLGGGFVCGGLVGKLRGGGSEFLLVCYAHGFSCIPSDMKCVVYMFEPLAMYVCMGADAYNSIMQLGVRGGEAGNMHLGRERRRGRVHKVGLHKLLYRHPSL